MKYFLMMCVSSLFLLLTSCYKDLGNYDYQEINELSVLGLSNSYEVDQDDSLKIQVELEGTKYADSSRFNFEWEVGRQIIYRYKDLKVRAGMSIGRYLGRYIVTDKETGAKTYFQFSLRVSSSTAGDLILVLSREDGRAELSYKRLDKDEPFVSNYFLDRFGKSLGTDPKAILINYNYMAGIMPFGFSLTTGGLQILLDNQWKVLDKNDLAPDSLISDIKASSFTNYMSPYPIPDVSNYKADYVHYQIGFWNYSPYGYPNQDGRMYMISNGALYYSGFGSTGATVRVNQKAPGNGKLSPALCFAEAGHDPPGIKPTLIYKGFKTSSYVLLFDEVNGKFLYSNGGGSPLTIITKKDGEYLPIFPGYKMIYATHTSEPNKCVAVLSKGNTTKLLYMHVPSDATAERTKPFAIEGELDVPSSLINEESKFYPMTFNPYLLFSTKDRLYKYNTLGIKEKVMPNQVLVSLSTLGYDANATLENFTVSRTEKTILLAVSNYGTDKEGRGSVLKGDVVKLNFDKSASEAKLSQIYSGISGFPVDIKIKYQNFLREGLDKDDKLIDKI